MIRKTTLAFLLTATAVWTGAAAAQQPKPRVNEAQARATALARVPHGRVKSQELEQEGGRLIYSYDIVVDGKPGIEEIHIDANTGTFLTSSHETASGEASEAKQESQAALRREAKITEAQAQATAAARVPGGRLKASELERENGRLIYSFEFTVPGHSGIEEVNVDAQTGQVVSAEHEKG